LRWDEMAETRRSFADIAKYRFEEIVTSGV